MKIFKEVQRFNQWWLILLMLTVLLFSIYSLVEELKTLENENHSEIVILTIPIVIVLVVNLLIFCIKLKTRIDERGINYQFFTFHMKSKHISWSELNKCYVRKYSPIREYGGWGYRGGWSKNSRFSIMSHGKAYNISGNNGIQLEFKDGAKLLFGTQESEKAKQVLKTYSSKLDAGSEL